MISHAYSIFDSKAAVFGPPIFFQNSALAIRSFTDYANDPSMMIHRHPEDFSLFQIGTFDDNTGVLSSITPVSLVTASGVKREVTRAAEIIDRLPSGKEKAVLSR